MKPRIDVTKYIGLGVGRAMLALSHETAKLMDPKLFELVKIRASQLNGCAYCLDMHTKDARLAGETEQRLYALSAWHETPFFTPRERAALEYTEAVTRVGDTHVPDDVYARVVEALRRGRDGGAHLCGRRDQRVESPGGVVPRAAGVVSAGAGRDRVSGRWRRRGRQSGRGADRQVCGAGSCG